VTMLPVLKALARLVTDSTMTRAPTTADVIRSIALFVIRVFYQLRSASVMKTSSPKQILHLALPSLLLLSLFIVSAACLLIDRVEAITEGSAILPFSP